MANGPVRVASIGMGWWSDVLADAIKRSGKIEIASCFTRSDDKRQAFAEKYGCQASPSYEAILADPTIEAIINTTPNNVHLETTRAAAEARKHIFLDKPIVRKRGLRIFVKGLEIGAGRSGIEIEVAFLDVFAVIPFAIRQTKQPFFENRIMAVPKRQRKAKPALAVGNAEQPIFAPAISAATGMIVRKVVPSIPIR